MVFSVIHLQDIVRLLHFGHQPRGADEYAPSPGTPSATAEAAAKVPVRLTWSEPEYPGVLDSELFAPSRSERSFFILTVAMIFVLSLCGNLLTFFVNVRRKMRPYFRSCLISLALSDLITTFFLSVTYISQFTVEYVQIWSFGDTMCSLVPFITTTAILVSSLTLVAIAMDRYFAVRNTSIGMWNPTCSFCLLFMALTWTASVTISSPIFFIYDLMWVYILSAGEAPPGGDLDGGVIAPSEPPTTPGRTWRRTTAAATTVETTTPPAMRSFRVAAATMTAWQAEASGGQFDYVLVDEPQLVAMCVSDKNKVGMFYFMVFILIFIPCIVAFLWLNAIIACTIWKRRRPISASQDMPTAGVPGGGQYTATSDSAEAGETATPAAAATASPINRKNSVRLLQVSTLVDDADGDVAVEDCPAGGDPPSATTTEAGPAPARPKCRITAGGGEAPKSKRELRHIRMFAVILLMMFVFLVCRLPAWVLLMMRMYGAYTEDLHWRLYFAFGLLHLTSCMLNPLFYTFLAETIEYAKFVKVKVFNTACGLRLCCERTRAARRHMKVAPQPTTNYGADNDSARRPSALPAEEVEEGCGGCWMRWYARWNFRGKLLVTADSPAMGGGPGQLTGVAVAEAAVGRVSLASAKLSGAARQTASHERDEGVDVGSCSGSCDGSECATPPHRAGSGRALAGPKKLTKQKSLDFLGAEACKAKAIYTIRAEY